MHRKWHVTADAAEHLAWPRCRFEFQRDDLGNWWRGKTEWIEDPLDRLDHLGVEGFTELVLRLTAEAEQAFERRHAPAARPSHSPRNDREPDAEPVGV